MTKSAFRKTAKITRRDFLAGTGALSLAIMMGSLSLTSNGCSDEDEVVGELIIGLEQDGYTREGDEADVGLYPNNINVAETLIELGANYEILPLLATGWEYLGESTWRFELRQGVTFHDGQPFNAEAVKYTLDRICPSRGSSIATDENSVKIIDDYTVEVTTYEQNMLLPSQLCHIQFGIMAPGSDPAEKLVGTGPFAMDEYVPEEYISVVRNDNYWGDKAELEKITFKFIPDRETRILALEAGDVDIIKNVSLESVSRIEDDDGLKVIFSSVGSYTNLQCNISGVEPSGILTESDIRFAIAYAVDRESIINQVWGGNAEENQTIIPPSVLGEYSSLVEGFSYDPERARTILDDAGWTVSSDGVRVKDDKRLSITLVSGFPSAEVHRPIPEILQSQLKEVGIEVKIIEVGETATYGDLLTEDKGDIFLEKGTQNNADPTFLPYLLHHTDGLYNLFYGPHYLGGEEFDALLDQARATADLDECTRLTAEALHILIDGKAINIPLASHYQIWAAKDKIEGFVAYPSSVNQRNFNQIYID